MKDVRGVEGAHTQGKGQGGKGKGGERQHMQRSKQITTSRKEKGENTPAVTWRTPSLSFPEAMTTESPAEAAIHAASS